MRLPLIALLCLCLCLQLTYAEGTRQLAPNPTITIDGNSTTDLAALFINADAYNNFASFFNDDTTSRLYINIQDPQSECIYMGFSFGHLNVTSPNPTRAAYRYRVKDPDGNVIFGPVEVGLNDANIETWQQAFNGPMEINGAGGYDAVFVSSADLQSGGWSGPGDYYVEFENVTFGGELLIDFWDITVADCTPTFPEEKTGRVWSYNWALFAVNDFGFPNRPFNGAFYVCAPDPQNPDAAFITRIDFNNAGFRPAAFNVAFNSFGIMNTGNVMEDRRSVELTNATQAEYAVFLNDPVDLCETAESGDIELLGVSSCEPGDYCVSIIATKEGQVNLLLDFDGPDDEYTPGSADIIIVAEIESGDVGETVCIPWDGTDGLGNDVFENSAVEIPVLVNYAQGIYHFPIYDAELMTTGFEIQAIRPSAPEPLLFYDDSQITVPSGSGEPAVQLSGCALPCHRWTNYVSNAVPGFGNLHTINSWWFSQLIVRRGLFFAPVYLDCEVTGPESICEGAEAELSWNAIITPSDAEPPAVDSSVWSGPGIAGSNRGESVVIQTPGEYSVTVYWLDAIGETCNSTCSIIVEGDEPQFGQIDTLIQLGDTIEVNGIAYSEGGVFQQTLTASNGCDSILTITILTLNTVVLYDFDDCAANFFDGTGMDYSEFLPQYPQPLSCAEIDGSIIFRENPTVNKHSCTPGVNDSPAMCVSSVEGCEYLPGDEKSIVLELNVEPAQDTAVQLTEWSFYQRAPEMYDWIDGESGINNYPTRFGVRILKDGVEVFIAEDLETSQEWTEEVFDLSDLEEFYTDTAVTYTFEILGYCVIGNGEEVTAFDIDELSVEASCVPAITDQGLIAGQVKTPYGVWVNDVDVKVTETPAELWTFLESTDGYGRYSVEGLLTGFGYEVTPTKNSDHMSGVSTLDLLRIQKHLLGIELFTSPYQVLAADANRSNTLSALDIVELRKLLLGRIPEFEHGPSWRVGPVGQDLQVFTPWNFRESVLIENLTGQVSGLDLIAVKIGDVTGDARLEGERVELRGRQEVALEFEDKALQAGEEFELRLKLSTVEQLYGLQLELDLSAISVSSITSSAIDISEATFFNKTTGILSVSWSDLSGIDGRIQDEFLVIRGRAGHSGRLSEFISIRSDRLAAEAYIGSDLGIVSINLSSSNSAHSGDLKFNTRIFPNPMRQQTTIHFYQSTSGEAEVRAMDLSGRIIFQRRGIYPAGDCTINMQRADLSVSPGMIFLEVMTQDGSSVHKLVVK